MAHWVTIFLQFFFTIFLTAVRGGSVSSRRDHFPLDDAMTTKSHRANQPTYLGEGRTGNGGGGAKSRKLGPEWPLIHLFPRLPRLFPS